MPKSASIMGGARANNGSQSGLLMAAGSVASLTDVYRTNVYAASGAVGSGMGFSPSMGNLWGVPASAGGSASGNAAAEWGPSASISDQALMDQVRVIIYGNDLASLTKKRVRTLLTEHFGVDLASRREIINNCVDVTLLERMSSDPQ
ncbi:hypothetical protein BC828DRAFT_388760 [Blastocladiella britannica]|nr:hypothetical protein BC828DRAFT_388760 [Blastocladiella britannica]